MEIKGKIIALLPLQSGQGKNGEWRKQEFVLETGDSYPKKICIALWGDKIDQSPLNIGSEVNVSFDVESREFNGKWYTDVKAWKVQGSGNGDSSGYNQVREAEPENKSQVQQEDDLPF